MDVNTLMGRLCDSLLREALYKVSTDYLLKSFDRPSAAWKQWTEEECALVVKKLKYTMFDKLILRRWEWFDCNEHEMSSESRCLALASRLGSTERLHVAVGNLNESILIEKEAILQFLWLVAGIDNSARGKQALNDSGVCVNKALSHSLFEALPRVCDVESVQSSLYASQQLFECAPGTGYRGWSSQQPLDIKKKALQSSLFGGLTHSHVDDINEKLSFPGLPYNTPTNLIPTHPGLDCFLPCGLSPCEVEGDSSYSREVEVYCNVWRQWEGWEAKCCYLSDAPCFVESGHLAFQRTREVGCVATSYGSPRPGDTVRQLMWDIDHLSTDQLGLASQECGRLGQALAGLLQLLITYCRSRLATITESCVGEFELTSKTHHLLPVCSFVVRLVQEVKLSPKRFELVNFLHSHAKVSQGIHSYPLLLALMSHTLEPYFRFIEQWVFLGQLDCGEDFGVYGNQDALEKRDEEYWRSGYVMTSCCTPRFLDSHAGVLLTAGKALNLLKLCNTKHPLCSGKVKPLKLRLHFDANGLQCVHEECSDYSKVVAEQAAAIRTQQDEMRHKEKKQTKEVKERQIAEALEEAEMIKRAEEAHVVALRLKKQSLLKELQQQIETARALKFERTASEKRNDAKMIEELTRKDELLTQREEKLAAEVRAELVGHYAQLSKEVELRQTRAEWKIKRLNLHAKRVEFMHSEDAKLAEAMKTWNEGLEYDEKQTLSPSTNATKLATVASSHDHVSVESHDDSKVNEAGPVPADNDPHSPLSHGEDYEASPGHTESKVMRQATTPLQPHNPSSQLEEAQQQIDHSLPSIRGEGERREALSPVNVQDKHSWCHGEAKESTNDVIHPSFANELGYPRLHTSRGHAPKSTVQEIIYGSSQADLQQVVSSRGHAPASTIQRLLYPLLHVATDIKEKQRERDESEELEVLDPSLSGASSRFTDDYAVLDETPSRDMLMRMLGPLPLDGTTVDSSFLCLYPLDSLLETCIALPLTTQSQLVNKALLDHFLNNCHIQDHFVAIKKFLLMEDGEFSHVLSTRLCEELAYSSSSRNLCSSSFLNPLLSFALEASLHGRCPEAQRLAFKLKYQPSMIRTQAVDALSFLELSYKVDWPSNIVITSSSIDKYNKIFQLLLQIKRASWALKTAFHHLRQSQSLGEQSARQLQTCRHEFQHFVNIVHGYVANQLFFITWREFDIELTNKVHSLDDLMQSHTKFLDNAIFRCLLSKKAKPVMNVVQEILSSILCFSVQSSLIMSAPHRSYKSMCDTHKRFSDATGLLIKVINKLVARGYQPHLEDLLLRLNFNNFYSQ